MYPSAVFRGLLDFFDIYEWGAAAHGIAYLKGSRAEAEANKKRAAYERHAAARALDKGFASDARTRHPNPVLLSPAPVDPAWEATVHAKVLDNANKKHREHWEVACLTSAVFLLLLGLGYHYDVSWLRWLSLWPLISLGVAAVQISRPRQGLAG